MNRLTDRTALITGAGSGIGRASALRLADEGAAVMCSDIDRQAAEGTALAISEAGGRAEALALDVTDADAVAAAIEATEARLGGFDILFNNAGIGGNNGWDATIAVNLTGVFNGLSLAAPRMAQAGGGVIINTASVAGLVGLIGPGQLDPADMQPGAGAYVAAKHGVAGLTRQYAVTFGPLGVRVNAIAPGYIETPMTAEFREDAQTRDFITALHPMGRLGRATEIAAVAAFLASDDASFVNGVVLPVDGGYTAR